jgi:hypothetical protein
MSEWPTGGTTFHNGGASGSVVCTPGYCVTFIACNATAGGATLTFPDGTVVPITANIAWWYMPPRRFPEVPAKLVTTLTPGTFVFTGTASYFMEWIAPQGGAG